MPTKQYRFLLGKAWLRSYPRVPRMYSLYGAFRNNAPWYVDPFGLADCQCGVDTSQQVDDLLRNIRVQFNRLSWSAAFVLCKEDMWDPYRGWDMHDFYQLGRCNSTYVDCFRMAAAARAPV